MSVDDADPQIVNLIRNTLLGIAGFKEGKTVSVQKLCDLVENNALLSDEDDFNKVYDAIDYMLDKEQTLETVGNPDDAEDEMLKLADPVINAFRMKAAGKAPEGDW